MEPKDVITLISIIVSFIVGAAGLIISLKNSRKTTFINSITSSRIKYIQDIRSSISEYCGLIYRFNDLPNTTLDIVDERLDISKSLDRLKYQIILYLNPEDKVWDDKIIDLIEKLRREIGENQETTIRKLIVLTQYLLKLEWEGAKLESRKGLISSKEKRKLNEKHYHNYLQHIQTTE